MGILHQFVILQLRTVEENWFHNQSNGYHVTTVCLSSTTAILPNAARDKETAIFIRKESEKNRRIMSSHNTNTYNNLLCLSTTTTLTTTTYIYVRTNKKKHTY